jgi:hypothetical protein
MDYTETKDGTDFILERYNGQGVIVRRMDDSINVRYTTMDRKVATSFATYLLEMFNEDVNIFVIPCGDAGFNIIIDFEWNKYEPISI